MNGLTERYGAMWGSLARRWKVALPITMVFAVLYAVGYEMAHTHTTAINFLLTECNPIPWIAAIAVLAYYFHQYDRYRAERHQQVLWRRWMVWSFTTGVLMMMLFWESPLNSLVPESMAAYTLKLMGPFEVPAPLIALGMPFAIIDYEKKHGLLWKILVFAHRPLVSSAVLLVLLVLWDMTDQMRLGLSHTLVFAVLPAVYLGAGIVVWMQSLGAFPRWPNLHHHLLKMGYVWAMELAMMGMGAMWFWTTMVMNPIHLPHLLWGMSPLRDQHMAGLVMTALALPTMSLVFWHFWEWLETLLREPEAEVIQGAERFLDRARRLEGQEAERNAS